MARALREALGVGGNGKSQDKSVKVDEVRIATAYFTPTGFTRIAPAMRQIPSVKLLLGTDPVETIKQWERKLGESREKFIRKKLDDSLRRQENELRNERDHMPFTKETNTALRQFIDSMRAGNIEVRRYDKDFLHAKAYIFTRRDADQHGKPEGVIAGSSNLTAAGLSHNLELNLGCRDDLTVAKARDWYDNLWEDAVDFDIAAIFNELFEPKTPFEIFLRVLWELYGDEVDTDAQTDQGLPLTSFQKHGVVRAKRLIDEIGGVIVADEVGLGKTFIAAEILAHYRSRRQRVLLICPAALRDTAWKHFIDEYELYLECVSFEQLARDRQLYDEVRRPNAQNATLAFDLGEYQLIIIDEAHNYRNPDSATRADALRALLYGERKDVLMLTATPVNNSLWDLYHLIRFFIKQDAHLADKGILSIKERFDVAMRTNPDSLSPDVLYPIIDATTVKRTRRFIKKYYRDDQIKGPDGNMQTIVFPEPKAISVRYEIDELDPSLFNLIETYFDPECNDCIYFARYKTDSYLKKPDPDGRNMTEAVSGFLLSGLLKRFESSIEAFRRTVGKLISQHNTFLSALDKGFILTTEFFKEGISTDDDSFDELMAESENTKDANLYDTDRLQADVKTDLSKLEEIFALLKNIKQEDDPKLQALGDELEMIAEGAASEAALPEDEANMRKVVIFSFFADTVRWINEYLDKEVKRNPKLKPYKDRFEIVVGSGRGESSSKADAAARFAPMTAGGSGASDETDILISTDVLAEGVNLQQARHIINYDMPWNPMRLVQRHGRIDRIGSQHSRVFLRTIFPAARLDDLLQLEERITRKIAMAAASVGVVSPIAEVGGADRDFTETREEIEKLLDEDASIYERGGTASSTQSGEEYRHTLRKELESRRDDIERMPWKSGSGMRKGKEQGIFFFAKVRDKRTYLRFVHTDGNWQTKYSDEQHKTKPLIDKEIGRCLRLIECDDEEALVWDEKIQNAAYDVWETARADIHEHWMRETDPANLQPKIRPLNRRVAEFLRKNIPTVDAKQEEANKALDILESPWTRRDENKLREWFDEELNDKEKVSSLIDKILKSGLEPFISPEPLSPINEDDIDLLVWMAITSESS